LTAAAAVPTAASMPAVGTAAEPAAAATPAADEIARARRELERLSALPPGTRLLDERRNAVARLIALLAARERRDAAPAAPATVPDASVPALAGTGPHPVAEVDTLRDQRDALASQRSSLEGTLRLLDHDLAALVVARRKADEALRLRQDQLARAGDADRERLQVDAELATLQARVAELEVARADRERRDGQARLEPLAQRLATIEREVDRVRDAQAIDDAALQTVTAASRRVRQGLSQEVEKLRSRLAAAEARTGTDDAAPRIAASLRSTLVVLSELDAIEQGVEGAWAMRRLAVEAGSDKQRQTAARDLLVTAIDQIDARVRVAQEQLDSARATARAQRALLDSLASDDPRRDAEQRVLDALTQEIFARERVQGQLARLRLLLTRSREDVERAGKPTTPSQWLEHAADRGAGLARAAWDYELFSATESSVVDGRAVTVNYGVTVGKSIGVLILFGAGIWFARVLARRVVAQLVRRTSVSAPFGSVLYRWLMWSLGLVVLIAVLKVARVPLTAFAFLGGALAIGVGFGTQNIIKNLISGMIILFERKLRVGDIVTIGNLSGTVAAVDLRATTVRGFDGIDFIVPNSSLLENQVSNWTYLNSVMRREVSVGVAYGTDLQRGKQVLLACAASVPGILTEPTTEVLVARFGDDGIEVRLQFWIRLQTERSGPVIESDLRLAIDAGLRAAGISIPFPQRDVHLHMVPSAPGEAGTGSKG
jgi:small-conductance mechanosensitive channel